MPKSRNRSRKRRSRRRSTSRRLTTHNVVPFAVIEDSIDSKMEDNAIYDPYIGSRIAEYTLFDPSAFSLRDVVASDDIDTLSLMLFYDPSIRTRLEGEVTTAARNGALRMLTFFANEGIDLSDALTIACLYGRLHVVQFLIENGMSPSADDNAPIRWAVLGGHLEIVRYLHQRGASLGTPANPANPALLEFAEFFGFNDIAQYIRENST